MSAATATAQPSTPAAPILEVKDLTVQLKMDAGMREVITGTSLTIAEGEAMGLVGESGSGKSMTAKAIARLLPKGAETQGSVTFDGTDVLALEGDALNKHRATVAVVEWPGSNCANRTSPP